MCIFTFTTISNERVWIIHLIKQKEREMPITLLKNKKLTYRIFFIKVFQFCLQWLYCRPFAVVLCSNSTPSVNFESTNWQKTFCELAIRDYTKTDSKRRGRESGRTSDFPARRRKANKAVNKVCRELISWYYLSLLFRGTQREYNFKPLKRSIVTRILVFKQ